MSRSIEKARIDRVGVAILLALGVALGLGLMDLMRLRRARHIFEEEL